LVGSNLAKVEQKVGLRINVQFCGHDKMEERLVVNVPPVSQEKVHDE
jgi:hypothetical protein